MGAAGEYEREGLGRHTSWGKVADSRACRPRHWLGGSCDHLRHLSGLCKDGEGELRPEAMWGRRGVHSGVGSPPPTSPGETAGSPLPLLADKLSSPSWA